MDGHMILYRGSLKSCNYHCSYCPFSKRPISERELAKDREQWIFFVRTFRERGRELGMGALMVVPYGEALIHPWYWEGLAGLSALSWMDAAGAQTNLSFPVRESLDSFLKAGGKPEKLRLWATFHPEMTTVEEFTDKCRQLKEAGIVFSAGAVGVPENAKLLLELRKKLPEEIYLWVNRMDGLRRPYTETETEDFLTVDPYFLRELAVVGAEESRCRDGFLWKGTESCVSAISARFWKSGGKNFAGKRKIRLHLPWMKAAGTRKGTEFPNPNADAGGAVVISPMEEGKKNGTGCCLVLIHCFGCLAVRRLFFWISWERFFRIRKRRM